MSRSRTLGRACALALCVVPIFAVSAQAAAKSAYLSVSAYPAGLYGAADTSTGSFFGFYDSGTTFVPQRVVQLRGGAIIADDHTATPIAVQAGDVFQVRNSSTNAVLAETTFTQPTIDPTSCVGQNGFSGTRTADADVTFQALVPTTRTGGYGTFNTTSRTKVGHLRVLGAGLYGGVFDSAIAAGEFLQANQDLESTVGDTDYSIFTSVTQAAGACPPPVKDTSPAKLLSFDLGTPEESVATFLKFGLTTFVGVDEPALISEELYLSNGAKLPIVAAAATKKCKTGYTLKVVSVKRKVKGKTKTVKTRKCVKSSRKLSLLGSGKTASTVAGVSKVVVRAKSTARKLLKGKTSFKATLVTTLRDASGNVTIVPTKTVTLKK